MQNKSKCKVVFSGALFVIRVTCYVWYVCLSVCITQENLRMSGEDAPDPATGLTNREKQAVRDTWAIVKQDIKGHGYGIFVR